MIYYVREGWKTSRRHISVILLLFCYQLFWGFLLYRFIESIMLPLLHQYPGSALDNSFVHLFWAEGQFNLLKTNLANSYLWTLFALFAARMVVTPLINAGLFYSIHESQFSSPPDPRAKRRRLFLSGIRLKGKQFFMLYWIQMALTIAPVIWIFPYARLMLATAPSYTSLLVSLLPWGIGWLIYGSLVTLLFTYLQFGVVANNRSMQSCVIMLRFFIPIAGLSLFIILIAGCTALLSTAVSLLWAGFLALMLHQSYHLISTLFKVWGVSAQYHYWSSKIEN